MKQKTVQSNQLWPSSFSVSFLSLPKLLSSLTIFVDLAKLSSAVFSLGLLGWRMRRLDCLHFLRETQRWDKRFLPSDYCNPVFFSGADKKFLGILFPFESGRAFQYISWPSWYQVPVNGIREGARAGMWYDSRLSLTWPIKCTFRKIRLRTAL